MIFENTFLKNITTHSSENISESESEYNSDELNAINFKKISVSNEKNPGGVSGPFLTGNRSTFTNIYNQLYPRIYFFACRFVNSEDAEDVTADAFCKLWKSDKQFPRIQSIRLFLQISVRNACINLLEHQSVIYRQKREFKFLRSDTIQMFDDEDEIKAEFLHRIHQALEKLPKQCNIVFKLAFLDGLKNKEISKRLHISQRSVANQKAKGLKFVKLFVLSIYGELLIIAIQSIFNIWKPL
jgi:RNA polymerase sigma-70 factor, ECF subfamily